MIDNLRFAVEAAWKVLLIGLVLGAGLPALFAVGVRSYAWGTPGATSAGDRPSPLGRPLAVVCLVLVVAFVALGVTVVVAQGYNKVVTFDHVYPTLKPKS